MSCPYADSWEEILKEEYDELSVEGKKEFFEEEPPIEAYEER